MFKQLQYIINTSKRCYGLEEKLYGISTALITPYNSNGINTSVMENLIKRQLDKGIGSVTLLGTTGEGANLNRKEKTEVLDLARKLCGKEYPFIVNVGEISVEKTTKNCRDAENAGASALLIVTPYYLTTSQTGIYDYYSYVASQTTLPIICYNVPQRTGFNLEADTIKKLYATGKICAVKQANGSLADCIQLTHYGVPIYCGDDLLTPSYAQSGAIGVISVISNVYPTITNNLFVQGKGCADREKFLFDYGILLEMCQLFFAEKNPMATKYFAYKNGLIPEYFLRLPLKEICSKTKKKIDSKIEEFAKYL